LDNGMVAFGEVGLSGEIRPVYNGEERLKEASGQGFTKAIIPGSNAPRHDTGNLKVVTVGTLAEAISAAFD
jgi:DNA repair protein RadA/Sms